MFYTAPEWILMSAKFIPTPENLSLPALMKRFPDDIFFIDQQSLATTEFNRCPGLRHNRFGTNVTMSYWLKHENECAPALPDVIIDLGAILFPTSSTHDQLGDIYRLVYTERLVLNHPGRVAPTGLDTAGNPAPTGLEQYLAVRRDLAVPP